MQKQLMKNLVRPLLPLTFSVLLLIILLCSLSQATEAEPTISSAATLRDGSYPISLGYRTGVSVCQQAENRVLNPSFERDVEKPYGQPDHWHEAGPEICAFRYNDPGPDTLVSAKIDASFPRDENCTLFVDAQDIPIEPGRFYSYSAMMQANLDLGDDAYLRVAFYSCEGDNCTYKGDGGTASVTDTQKKWVRVTGSAPTPADADHARVLAVLPASSVGEVWFDDIFLGLATCLDIGKSDHPDPVSPGQKLTYTITYSNTGRENATNVHIIETYDRQYVYLTDSIPLPDISDNHWVVPTLGAGVSGTIMAIVQVQDDTEGRAYLFNEVEIFGAETMTIPARTARITTAITSPPDGCAVYLSPTNVETTVGPDDSADYDLTLGNAGSCNGRANLAATSSQGWDVDIVPSPPYTLSSASVQEVKVSPVLPACVYSGTVDVTSITATLVCGSPCNNTATETATLTTTVTGTSECKVYYLPLFLHRWPPIPELYQIDNPDGDGRYDVCWSDVDWGDSYVLEEDTNYAFSDAKVVYTGMDTCYSVSGRGAARYYYRVKACYGWQCSGWSDVEKADVLWETEPNDDALTQANGPVASGLTYYGTFTSTADVKDYFYFDLTTTHTVELWLTNIPTSHNYDLVLRDSRLVPPIGQSDEPDNDDEHILTSVLPARRYYIQVYHRSGSGSTQSYHLRVVYQ